MRRNRGWIFLSCLSFLLVASGQRDDKEDRLPPLSFEPHIVLSSSADYSKPGTLLVLLHGEGGDEKEFAQKFLSMAERLAAVLVSFRGPLRNEGGGYAWFKKDGSLKTELDRIRTPLVLALRKVRKNFAVEANRIVLAGFSQGAVAALDLGLCYPGLFRGGVLCLSGKGYASIDSKESMKRAAALGLRVSMIHGLKDDPEKARQAARRLTEGGVATVLYELGMGHAFPPGHERILKKALVRLWDGDE